MLKALGQLISNLFNRDSKKEGKNLYLYNTCKYCRYERNLYGVCTEYCEHPKRSSLDNVFGKILRYIFRTNNHCAAAPGYSRYCPLYEDDFADRPTPPPPI